MKATFSHAMALFLVFLTGLNLECFSQNYCKIELGADIRHCTCLNDGEITFKLTKSADCQLDTLNIRYSLYSPLNSISSENSISPVFSNLPPGHYIGIVSALHHTGEPGIGANIIIYDTLELNINTSYTEPKVGILNQEFTLENRFGIIRSLPCMATGIVQMRITGGKMPYTINVMKYDGSHYVPYKTEIFDNQQHNGNNPADMDYHEYYNVDSLSAGYYRLTFTDACGYTLPDYEVQVKATPTLESTVDVASNANNNDANSTNKIYTDILNLNDACNSFAKDASYYVLLQRDSGKTIWKYRWIDPAVNGHEADTSDWKNITFDRLEHVIENAERYCDLWGQVSKLQITDTECHGVKEYSISYSKPSTLFRHTPREISIPASSYTYTDSCGKHIYNVQKTQYDYFFSPPNDKEKLLTFQNEGSRNIRYYLIDTEQDTIISQGVPNIYGGKAMTYQHIFEFDSIYHGKTAKFKVLDAKGCTIEDQDFTISSKPIVTITNPSFNIYGLNETANYCDYSMFTQYYTFTTGVSDLDTFQITESPGGLSNFTMVYKADLNRWVRLDSNSNITISNYHGDIAINGLRSMGKFTYHYVSGCYTTNKNQSFIGNDFGIGKYYVPEDPAYKIEPTCTGIRIIPTAGFFKQHYFRQYDNVPLVNNVRAVFRLYGNPSLPDKITGYYQLGDTIDITLEGNIRIEMCDEYNYTKADHLCHFRDTTIKIGKQPLQYDYFYSYCCHIGDTASTVRTRAKGGIPPYRYSIHDKYRNLLDSNQVGDFYRLPLPHHDTVYLKVTDQCGTSFIYKGQIIEQQLIKKAWFEDGTTHKNISDSSWCQFFAITLDNIGYHWDGPHGFSSDEQNPRFYIPVDSNMSGKYYLSIQDSVCGLIKDSLMLKVITKSYVPELIWIEDSICSGQDYDKHGFRITSSPSEERRIYYDTLVSLMDDSTFLKLTILPVYRQLHPDSVITPFDEYHYAGLTLTDTGLYEIKLKTACGCDSIVYLYLMFTKYLPCPDAVDYNGNTYPAIRINKYCWTIENLKSTNYSDGRPIEQIYEYHAYEFPNTAENVNIFGRLYDWYAAIDTGSHPTPDANGNVQGICPEGWLLPSAEDFAELHTFTVKQLRSPLYWLYEPGTNESGFTSLPAGFYDAFMHRYSNLLGETYYWSTPKPDLQVIAIQLFGDCLQECQNLSGCNSYSVRCIKKE